MFHTLLIIWHSRQTFYITDAVDKEDGSSKPARACNVCYETVFPVLDSETEFDSRSRNDSGIKPNSNGGAKPDSNDDSHSWDTITSLSNFTAWLSTPSFSVQTNTADSAPLSPRALMGMDFERTSGARPGEHLFGEGKKGRVRLRSLNAKPSSGPRPRPLSSLHMLEGFDEDAATAARAAGDECYGSSRQCQSQGYRQPLDSPTPASGASAPSGVDEQPARQPQRPSVKPAESTVKRKERFSLPAIALQPLNVTARTAPMGLRSDVTEGPSSGGAAANGAKERQRTRRFSLVLGGRYQSRSSLSLALGEGDNERRVGDADMKASGPGVETGEKSMVMTKLSELLRGSSSRARMG
jgi:FYVE/RhoGEF/PH domain-containing protein 5/6